MLNYTECGEIIRGSLWPPGGDHISVLMTKSTGWIAGWDWELHLSRGVLGATPDLILDADSALIDGTTITITFHATEAQTSALPGTGAVQFNVELYSVSAGVESYYDAAQGIAAVRDPVGEG